MIGIIDTSSLVAIARYYLPIKDEVRLLRFVEAKLRSGELVFLSTIHLEASRTQKGIAIKLMKFLDNSELRYNDADLMPPAAQRFSNLLDNNFCVTLQKKKLTSEAYSIQKAQYMKTGDAKLLLYALNHSGEDPVIITEETMLSNDGKIFKKLPAICEILGIKHMTVAEWLVANGISLNWSHPSLG